MIAPTDPSRHVLLTGYGDAPAPSSFRVIVPLATLKGADALIQFAAQFASAQGDHSEIILLGIVEESGDPGHDANEARLLRKKLSRTRPTDGQADLRILVRNAPSQVEGIRSVVADEHADMLVLSRMPWLQSLALDPPCDTIVCQPPLTPALHRVLLAVRGGPHAELALGVALAIGRPAGAELTVMHIDRPDAQGPAREREQRLFHELLEHCSDYRRLHVLTLTSDDAAEAIVEEAAHHDLLILGAGIRPGAEGSALGLVPESILGRRGAGTVIVKTGNPVDPSIFEVATLPIDVLVNRWFANNTFHCREFSNVAALVEAKERSGLRISLALMATPHGEALAGIVDSLRGELQERNPLVDEFVVVAESNGKPFSLDPAISVIRGSDEGDNGPGYALWRSVRELSGDIVAWIDGDIRNIHPRMVYGVVGPLLMQERLQYVKGFYERPHSVVDAAFGDGRLPITELTARPLLNLFFPELSGVVEPLCREHAARRAALSEMPVFAGQGVEVGLLIDFLQRFGLDAIAQSDLETRVGRDLSVDYVTQRAFAVIQVIVKRLGQQRAVDLLAGAHPTMKLILKDGEQYHIEQLEAGERELPPPGARGDVPAPALATG